MVSQCSNRYDKVSVLKQALLDDGNEHDSHAVVDMNDEFVVEHVLILPSGIIGIYRYM